MISVQEAISRFRRDATMSNVLKAALGCGMGMVLALHFFPLGKTVDPTLLLMALGGVWLSLWYRTMKGSRMAAESSSLIAVGRFEQAEVQIEQTLRSFSMSRSVKSMSLLNLALVRLAQKRWPETALLCREVLGNGGRGPAHLSKSSRLLLADSLLEMGDVRGTFEALSGLYNHRLSLTEALNLHRVQCEYLAQIGAWPQLLEGLASKVQMSEIMPCANAARIQAILALAAKKTGNMELSNWLRRRVEILADVTELATERPMLWELWREQ